MSNNYFGDYESATDEARDADQYEAQQGNNEAEAEDQERRVRFVAEEPYAAV